MRTPRARCPNKSRRRVQPPLSRSPPRPPPHPMSRRQPRQHPPSTTTKASCRRSTTSVTTTTSRRRRTNDCESSRTMKRPKKKLYFNNNTIDPFILSLAKRKAKESREFHSPELPTTSKTRLASRLFFFGFVFCLSAAQRRPRASTFRCTNNLLSIHLAHTPDGARSLAHISSNRTSFQRRRRRRLVRPPALINKKQKRMSNGGDFLLRSLAE